ncbi:hypothetical protein IGI04_011708 [Brassica rapa subsp. trilocularis]|uniref:DUF538 family protein n=1 Tax=Brassica rapa subsp. trilocularis TaxID=1813537 RepID=A0ABQ7N3V3_BRACM|nr:hypothetical protein IGI04_011708 [Brassica rapa subsp. trilocularis]
MGESFDIQNLISFGDDLISLLNSKNGFDVVSQSFDHSEALHFACDEDFNQIQESIKDCKKKTEEAYSDESARDDEIELVADELKDLKAQWASTDEKRQSLKRKERDDLRAEKKLSMYACVTKVIPEADVNDPFKISAYMVDREKRVEKFQLETNEMSAYESCNKKLPPSDHGQRERVRMDQILNKVGSYWLGQKANKQLDSVGDDINKPLPELLQEFGLPVGIFPRDATNYEFNEHTKKLTVFIPSICEVGYKDSSVLRFTTTVTGFLEKGKLADVEGMKTKLMIWVKVTSISVDSSKIHFNAGVKKSRRRDAYEVLRDGVEIDKF